MVSNGFVVHGPASYWSEHTFCMMLHRITVSLPLVIIHRQIMRLSCRPAGLHNDAEGRNEVIRGGPAFVQASLILLLCGLV